MTTAIATKPDVSEPFAGAAEDKSNIHYLPSALKPATAELRHIDTMQVQRLILALNIMDLPMETKNPEAFMVVSRSNVPEAREELIEQNKASDDGCKQDLFSTRYHHLIGPLVI